MVKIMNVIVAVIASAAILLHRTEAEDYTVGDDLGWTVPPDGAVDTYEDWAAEHTPFVVNVDTLTFQFQMGQQDVASVNKVDFDNCFTTNPLWVSSAPTKVVFDRPGTFYFVGTYNGHCAKGQKMAVTWVNSQP
ncbi:PREDICTED: umecyanin-like [Fragaria vesca subsp. vesca]|uniref:umecyanin-like n=1 Tax=Fragaria vesca subsp. vesca TaxID=101020 RepID=UPI0002C2F2E5|nr:PREDICTED: umecyanin-like [Fragaria vesca subsp. vesca]